MSDLITSTANPRVKAVAALRQTKARRDAGRYLVEGPNAVGEALVDGVVETIFGTADALAEGIPVWGSAVADVETVEVADHVLDKLADSRTPQGVVAVARMVLADLADVVGRGVLVVCEEVSDPGNAGNIIRTADAAGATAVVLTRGSVDPYNPKAVRSAAGSTTHLPIVTDVTVDEVVAACRSVGQRIVSLDGGGTEDVFSLESRTAPVALIFGNEAHGLSPNARGSVDAVVSIPVFGRAESLNLATAVAVTLYAAARRGNAAT